MKIGILQAGHAPNAMKTARGDYTHMYSELLCGNDFTYETWSVVDMDFPSGPDEADGWLISGSRHGAYEDHPFIVPLEQLIRDIVAADRPLVGVCFGHQIIAQALGGTVEKFDGGWSVGLTTYTLRGETFNLNAWHQDQVTALPQSAANIGSSPFCENAMLYYEGKALTIQPHPEFDARAIKALLDTKAKGVVPDDLQAIAAARLPHEDNNAELGAQLGHFFKTKSLL